MTSPALAKLLGPEPGEPQPIEWIKVRRHAPYIRLVVPACEVCGDGASELVWYHAKTGRAPPMCCAPYPRKRAVRPLGGGLAPRPRRPHG